MSTNTKISISDNAITNTSTFEAWKDLTNEMVQVFQSTVTFEATGVTVPSTGMSNVGNILLDGDVLLYAGHKLVADNIEGTASATEITISENTKILGDLIVNQNSSGNASSVIQFQTQSATDTWHLRTSEDHTQLTLGTSARSLIFYDTGVINTPSVAGQQFILDNRVLGPTIDGIAIGNTTAASATFTDVEGTTITATTGFTGDLTGDVLAADGSLVLDSGSAVTARDAVFIGKLNGDVLAENSTLVLDAGTNGSNATFKGNIKSVNTDATILDTSAAVAQFTGNVSGNTTGNHNGIVGNSVPASVTGTTITANTKFSGNLEGDVTGNVTGNTTGNHNGVIGNTTPAVVTGTTITANTRFYGPLTGDVTGNVTGTQTGNVTGNVTGSIKSVDGTIALTNGATADDSLFSGVASRANHVRIDSRADQETSTYQDSAHYIAFHDGNGPPGELGGTTNRSAGNSSWQNLEDHVDLSYNPVSATLTTSKVKADVVNSAGNTLVDISADKFYGNATSATSATSADFASSAGACTGNSATASKIFVTNTEMDQELGLTFAVQDNSSSLYRSIYSDGGVTFNPSANRITVNNINMGNAGNLTGGIASFDNSVTVTNTAQTGTVTADIFRGQFDGNVLGDIQGNVTGSSGSCTGNANTASGVAVHDTESTTLHAILFSTSVPGGGDAYREVRSDIGGISFDPADNHLTIGGDGILTTPQITQNDSTTTSTFAGNVSIASGKTLIGNVTGNVTGNVSGSSGSCSGTATKANKMYVTEKDSGEYRVLLGGSNTDGHMSVYADNALKYDTGNNILSGHNNSMGIEAHSVTTTNATITNLTLSNNITLAAGKKLFGTVQGSLVGNVTGNVTGSAGTAGTAGSCTGNSATATKPYVTNTETDNAMGLVFAVADNSTNTYRKLYTDSGGITFRPHTNELIVNGTITCDTLNASNFTLPSSINANLVGNVTGNVTGNVSGSSGSCTGNANSSTRSTQLYIKNTEDADKLSFLGIVNPNQNTGYFQVESDLGLNFQPSTNTIFASTFDGYLDGTAKQASKWTNEMTLTLSGDCTGSVSFDGSDTSESLQVNVKDNGTFTVAANRITGLTAKLTELFDEEMIPLDRIYPVGSVFISINSDNPGNTIGGNWSQISHGRVLLGAGSGNDGTESKTFTNGSYGGKYNHKLTVSQMPKHSHSVNTRRQNHVELFKSARTPIREFRDNEFDAAKGGTYDTTDYTNSSGSSGSHNNIQPYMVVYMWKRVST